MGYERVREWDIREHSVTGLRERERERERERVREWDIRELESGILESIQSQD